MKWNNDNRTLLLTAAFFGPAVIAFSVLGGKQFFTDGWFVWSFAIGGFLLYWGSGHLPPTEEDVAEKLARTPDIRPQHPREAMMKYFMRDCGGHPTLEQARDYISSHQWWKPPYCLHKEIPHCKECPNHTVVDSYRIGSQIVGTNDIRDCRFRHPVEHPSATACMLCAHCRPHKNDELHDCGVPLWTADGDRPNGMDYYYPYYYPRKEDECPYLKPSFSEERVEREWKHRHDGQLLSDIRFMDNGKKPREELEAELDEFIRISTPGSPESKKSYVPEWAAKEAKKNREKGMT